MAGRFDNNVFVFSSEQRSRRRLENRFLWYNKAVRCFATPQDCLQGLRTGSCDLLIVDCDGHATEKLGALGEAMQIDTWLTAIVLVEAGDIPKGVEAIKRGAFDCLEKPVRDEPLRVVMELASSTRAQHAVSLKALIPTESA